VVDYLKDLRGLMAIRMLVEGCSIRAVERLTEIRQDTIIDLFLCRKRLRVNVQWQNA
jgi:hypothetical protein